MDEVLDAYNQGDADFHTIVADMAEIPRSQAKTINLGLFYGMGKNKLQAELGVSKDKAEDLFISLARAINFTIGFGWFCRKFLVNDGEFVFAVRSYGRFSF